MRGTDRRLGGLFSYIDLEAQARCASPLWPKLIIPAAGLRPSRASFLRGQLQGMAERANPIYNGFALAIARIKNPGGVRGI